MNVCIDGIGVTRLFGTSLYSYTYELIDNLLDIYPQPHYDIVWDSLLPPGLWNKHRNISFSNPHINRRQNDYSRLEEHIRNNKINIFHSPNNGFSIPPVKAAKYVMTVHDLLPVSNKGFVDF